ncbi:MAG: alpha/beta hydrolase [Ferruginibacter sp.]
MKTFGKWLLIFLCVLLVVYFAGPSPEKPVYSNDLPVVPSIDSLESYIDSTEQKHTLKRDNQARIVWVDSTRSATEYAIVYLHGFSASQGEGDPVHRQIANTFGCNLYLSRLAEHGIDTVDQLIGLTPDNYWESAKEALMIGSKLGKKVILMGTSTGGTLALQLAATYPERVHALILYSPNIEINDPNAWLLNNPWGLQIARLVKGSKYHDPDDTTANYLKYWNKPYRLEALVALQEMLESSMNQNTFAAIQQPVLMAYYFKDEQHQDPVVKVSAMKRMFEKLATPPALKKAVAIPTAGDHVMGSRYKSKDTLSVTMQTNQFMREVLLLRPRP